METDAQLIVELIEFIDKVLDDGENLKGKYASELQKVEDHFQKSAGNLLAYVALRNNDISYYQQELAELGLSSLGRAESHVVANLVAVRKQLLLMQANSSTEDYTPENLISIKESKALLDRNTQALFGPLPDKRDAYIMVSLSSDHAYDYNKLKKLIVAGMDCARINCAHDDAETWLLMINNIKKANKELSVNCKILMDLGGPKLRTGAVPSGPRVLKVKPKKDQLGYIVSPCKIIITWDIHFKNKDIPVIPVLEPFKIAVNIDDTLKLKDLHDKKRNIRVLEVHDSYIIGEVDKTTYFKSANKIQVRKEDKIYEVEIASLPAIEQPIVLKKGDHLILENNNSNKKNFLHKNKDISDEPASICCTLPQVFADIREGESVLLNDGKIGGHIKSASNEKLVIEITRALERGSALRGDKGINFPNSNLNIKGLMPKDIEDLKFIVKHADIVNMSFVSTPEDIHDLMGELKKLNASHLAVMLKIETQKAFSNLPLLLLTAMQYYPVGIMIARGDLAPEVGWVKLAEIQEEMLWFCEAAHIPVVWATQVLESLAQKGIPSRAEITDAAMGQRADCVMLNKGEYIVEAVEMLHEILTSMKYNQYKKSPILRKLSISYI